MTNAPESIWVGELVCGLDKNASFHAELISVATGLSPLPQEIQGRIKYIRTDLHLALVAAAKREARNEALREAATVCKRIRIQKANGPMPERACFDYEQAILALMEETDDE